MKKYISIILAYIPVLLGVVCLGMAFLPGLIYEVEGFGMKASSHVTMYTLFFGKGELLSSIDVSFEIDGGLSIFGLIAFILLVLAIVTNLAAKIFKVKNENIPLTNGALFVLAGICALLIKVAGTNIESITFHDAYSTYSLGVGTILFAVFAIIAGLVQIIPDLYRRLIKK